jgi:chorismate synthase
MNKFGQLFSLSIYGESHGASVGIIMDGCPPGIGLRVEDFMHDISRRKSGAKGTTPRIESDMPIILSGVFNEKTTGAPINIMFENNNIKSKDYSNLVSTPRPGHSDYVADKKYKGFNDYRGGGHFSGRLTLCLVAAGVLAKKIIPTIGISASLISVGGSKEIEKTIDNALAEGDSVGGIVECRVTDIPIGLGEPFFDSLESQLSHIVFAIPAVKGIEFGNGFEASRLNGSENNDNFNLDGTTVTNNAGGINGGISNGNELVFRIAIKPTSSISKIQKTANFKEDKLENLKIVGRHDACIALRVPVVLEAATAIVLADNYLRTKAY